MRRFDFTDEQLRAIARDRFQHVDPRVPRRNEMLWLKSQGETHERIAPLAEVSRRTVPRLHSATVARPLRGGWSGGGAAVL